MARKADKRKAEDEAKEVVDAPATKEPRTEGKVEDMEVVKPEENTEKETDALQDKRPAIKDKIGFNTVDTTINVIPSMGDKLLTAISEGGLQYLIAGARANVGVKAGRYMYEVKIIEVLNPPEMQGSRAKPPMPRQLIRIGFSTAGSPLVLGDSEDHIGFDSEGFFFCGQSKTQLSQRITREQVIAVVINMDAKSPNHNTISMFRDGERITKPQAIPDRLHGKVLYPHISFRNVTVQILMGPQATKPLPFACRTLQGAAQADTTVAKPKAGACEVLFPVACPDEGTFDWLKGFLQKNPDYVELSDRKITEWAISSGLWKHKTSNWKNSNDKPEFNFGLPSMDDGSIRHALYNLAPICPRNYVIMEVKSNLVAAERKEYLKRFRGQHFKKVACVVMGEPPTEYKQTLLDTILAEKQEKEQVAWRAKTAKKKIETLRQKQLAEAKQKEEKEAQEPSERDSEAKEGSKSEQAVATTTDSNQEDAAKVDGGDVKEKKDVEKKDAAKAEEKKDDENVKDRMEEDEEKEPPKVELSEEEKKLWFHPRTTSDLTTSAINQAFADFTIPETGEGFDAIRFEWQSEAKSREYLQGWVRERKLTSRIEDLQPSQWFQDKLKEWQSLYSELQAKQEQLPPAEEVIAKKDEKEDKEQQDEESSNQAGPGDIYTITDICDVGKGEPLFKYFTFADWVLLQLRYELFLLQAAFKKDVDDSERPGIHGTHFIFYYSKYFRKQLNPKSYGVNSNSELTALVKDTVLWNEQEVLTSPLAEDVGVEMFVKLTEDKRRQRQRRIDAGDETARLAISPLAMQVVTVGKTASVGASGEGGGAGTWQAAGPMQHSQQWSSGGKGASYQQGGFRSPGQMTGGKRSGKAWGRW